MKKWIKRILRIAGLLIVIGIIAAIVGFAVSGFDFSDISGNTYETRKAIFTTGKTIERIVMDFGTTDITVEYTKDAENITITYEVKSTKSGKALTKVTEKDENGTISFVEKTDWKGQINLFDFHEMKATVTLPENFAAALDFKTDTGDIIIKGAKVTSRVELSTDTGDIFIENSEFSGANIDTDTGDVKIVNASFAEGCMIETDTGDAELNELNAKDISISTDTGEADLRNVSSEEKILIETDTGDVSLEGNINTPELYVETDTGDVDGEDATVNSNAITINTTTGDLSLNLVGAKSEYQLFINTRTGDTNVKSTEGGPRKLKFSSNTGDCEIYFAN